MLKVFSILLLSLVFEGCQNQVGTPAGAPPGGDYKNPGHAPVTGAWGGEGVTQSIDHRFIVSVQPAFPATLVCDKNLNIDVELQQSAKNDCSDVDFTALFNAAKGLADSRVAQLSCPTTDCTSKKTWYTCFYWDCSKHMATFVVKEKVQCFASGATAPTGVTPPTPPLAGPTSQILDGAENTEVAQYSGDSESIQQYVNKLPNYVVPCKRSILVCVRYNFREASGTGSAPSDYSPYVSQANNWAQLDWAQYNCKGSGATTCTKAVPFTVLRDDWSYSGSGTPTIQVNVYFMVDCTK